jgi:hypothetical protein
MQSTGTPGLAQNAFGKPPELDRAACLALDVFPLTQVKGSAGQRAETIYWRNDSLIESGFLQTGAMERQLILAAMWFLAAVLATSAISLVVLVILPYDCFRTSARGGLRSAGGELHGRAWRFFKNLLGSILLLVGAILSIPLIPGPGLLIAAAGILLVDFPGRARMLRKLLRPSVLRSINRLRHAFAQEPLLID